MLKQDTTEILRDCEASLIPSGVKVTLRQGSLVVITQALGNAYTVHVNGNLARVAGCDGDALGMVILEETKIDPDSSLEDHVWNILKNCFDPEIPVNIVDLGLIYECHINENNDVTIKMTLTAPACGMGPVLVADIEQRIKNISGINNVKIDLVFDPPWDRNMMSDVAKLQLGML